MVAKSAQGVRRKLGDGLTVLSGRFSIVGMRSAKPSFFADLYRKVGEGLGLLDPHDKVAAGGPDEARKAAAREALRALERYHAKVSKAGVTEEEIRSWIRDGRRV